MRLTQEDFGKVTGGQVFIKYFVIRNGNYQTLLKLRASIDSKKFNKEEQFDSEHYFLNFNHRAVQKFVKEGSPAGLALVHQQELGLGIQARDTISEGTIIDLYYGELKTSEAERNIKSHLYSAKLHDQSENLIGYSDGSEFTGLAPFINDGLPNCFMVPIMAYNGLPIAVAIMANKEIRRGENIQVDYSSTHHVKGGKYIISEMDMEHAKLFFTKPKQLRLLVESLKNELAKKKIDKYNYLFINLKLYF